jgi:DNA repair photolyase
LRDLDLLRTIGAKNRLRIHMTITTTDVNLARTLEPRAPRPDLRFKAVKRLVAAGISTSVNCAPILPGITDSPKDLESVVQAAAEAGASAVAAIPLFLKPCSEKIFMPFLQEHFPHLAPLYKTRYAERAFLPLEYKRRVSALVKRLCFRYGITARDDESVQQKPSGGFPGQQMSLFVPEYLLPQDLAEPCAESFPQIKSEAAPKEISEEEIRYPANPID